jgi:uncharacterized membrane protein
MEHLKTATSWLKQILEISLVLLCLAIVIQIIAGPSAPFLPGDVVANILNVTKQLGSEGLVGLFALGVLLAIFNRKSD